VAHTDELEVKWLRVSHLCPHLTPRRGNGTIGKFNQVKCILYVRIKLIHRHHFGCIKLTSQTRTDDRQGLCAEVFRQQKIFVEAKTKRLKVIWCRPVSELGIPTVNDHGSVSKITYRLLPL